jgi:hypothetical protein
MSLETGGKHRTSLARGDGRRTAITHWNQHVPICLTFQQLQVMPEHHSELANIIFVTPCHLHGANSTRKGRAR